MRILQVVAGLAAVGGALWLAFTIPFRVKFRPMHDAVRQLNRRVLNPRQLHTAGQPGARASVVRHVGRTSGTPRRTPVVAVPTEHGFVMALPYGPRADWVRNVLAAGSATIQHDGATVPVDQPRLLHAADVAAAFSPREQRTHRLYGVDDFLLLRRRTEDTGPAAGVRQGRGDRADRDRRRGDRADRDR